MKKQAGIPKALELEEMKEAKEAPVAAIKPLMPSAAELEELEQRFYGSNAPHLDQETIESPKRGDAPEDKK